MTEISQSAQHRGRDVPSGWEGILERNERILWQGRPDQGFHFNLFKLPAALFGLAFAGFALFWMVMASRAGGAFWMFGLIHFTVGIGLTFSAVAWGTLKRRGTWYTLTDRRAIIATDLPLKGRQLDSYTIGPDTQLTLRDGTPGSVIFARSERHGNRGGRYTVDIGFERIPDANHTYGLMREIQRRADQGPRR